MPWSFFVVDCYIPGLLRVLSDHYLRHDGRGKLKLNIWSRTSPFSVSHLLSALQKPSSNITSAVAPAGELRMTQALRPLLRRKQVS